MSRWKTQEVDFGTMKKNSIKRVIFESLERLNIKSIKGDCGCTTGKYYPETKELVVTYKAGEIPKQVTGDQTVSKKLRVTYSTGEIDTLTISGTKTQN